MSKLYSEGFYDRLRTGSESSARRVLPLVFDRYPHGSIVDIGCGAGSWLHAATELGVEDVLGVDGPWVQPGSFKLGQDRFVTCEFGHRDPDLRGRRFDLSMTTEVAEHLPRERCESFVALLCSLADVVVFSGAVPGQGGMGHVNERWQSFWIDLFDRQGYGVQDFVRPAVWHDQAVEPWYRQNLLVFEKGAAADIMFDDVIHPFFFEREVTKVESSPQRRVVRGLRAIRSNVRKRLGR